MIRISSASGVPRIRIQDLRHSHASLLIEMGFNILEISKRLGHSSVKITWDTYRHLYPDKDKQIAFGLDEVKATGITRNATTEAQLLDLLKELKKGIPGAFSRNLIDDQILLYNPLSKKAEGVSREQFYEDVSGKGYPQKILTEMMEQGYYHLATNAVYCFESQGIPAKYL